MVREGIAKHQQPKLWLLVSAKSWKMLVCQDKGFSLIEDIPTFPSGPVPKKTSLKSEVLLVRA